MTEPKPGPLPLQPADEGGPVFREPWEASAFALAVQLCEAGHFTWSEWSRALAAQIRIAQAHGDADLGDTYYRHWLEALERLVRCKGITTVDELDRRTRAWREAAERAPHGEPIALSSIVARE